MYNVALTLYNIKFKKQHPDFIYTLRLGHLLSDLLAGCFTVLKSFNGKSKTCWKVSQAEDITLVLITTLDEICYSLVKL